MQRWFHVLPHPQKRKRLTSGCHEDIFLKNELLQRNQEGIMERTAESKRFLGRWVVEGNAENIFIEFLPHGRLSFTGLWGEDVSEYMDLRHPLDFHDGPTGPTWDLEENTLRIFLNAASLALFDYAFSNGDTTLMLTNRKTNDALTFVKVPVR
jgi:hypothetical protein